jgi:hypothetical protein
MHVVALRAAFPLAAAGVVIPCWTFLITRLVLLGIALNETLRGRPSPYEGDIMDTSPGWPPVIAPSFPFWLCLPVLLVLAVITIFRPSALGGAFKPGFVAAYLVLSAGWALLFAASFSETEAWHRDSGIPGIVLLGVGLVVSVLTIWRALWRALRRVRALLAQNILMRRAAHRERTS